MKPATANPLSIDEFRIGAVAALSQNVSMSSASVNISISSAKISETIGKAPTFNHSIVMNASFSIRSEYDQNCNIAFAYPKTWGDRNQDVVYPIFNIRFEEQVLPYTLMDGSDLEITPETPEDYAKLDFLDSVRLAIVNVSLMANQSHILSVSASMNISLTQNLFRFFYCVGSARAWKGATQETVRMTIENADAFMETSFYPNESLTVIHDGQKSIGEWRLEFSSFEEDFVHCNLLQSQWPYTQDSVVSMLLGGAIIVLIVSLVLAIIVIKKKS
jgi:hypothetical protein